MSKNKAETETANETANETTNETANGYTLLTNISPGACLSGKYPGREYPDMAVLIIVGTAISSDVKETDYGVSTFLKGHFQATSLVTGEVFHGSKLFLPGGYCDMAATALADNDAVEVGVQIETVTNTDAIAGYIYKVTHIIKQNTSPMEKFKALMSPSALAALENIQPIESKSQTAKREKLEKAALANTSKK